mgnify:CR=1 FL=1
MNKEQLEAFAREAAKTIRSRTMTFEQCSLMSPRKQRLMPSWTIILACSKHQLSEAENSCNGYAIKLPKTEDS